MRPPPPHNPPTNRHADKVRKGALAIGVLLAGLLSIEASAGLQDRAYVFSGQELRVIDETDFSLVEGTVPLPSGSVVGWWNTLDQKRLALVTKEKRKKPATFTVIDLETLKVVRTATLSMNPTRTIPSESGRRGYVLNEGLEKKDVRPTLFAVDGVHGDVTATIDLPEVPAFIFLNEDETKVGLINYGVSSQKLVRRQPARYDIHDAVSLEKTGSVELPGPVTRVWVNHVNSLIYLMDTGVDKKNPKKSTPGHLYVLDPERAELLADLELGMSPGPLTWDAVNQRYYVLTLPRKSKTAVAALQSVVDHRIAATLELPMEPLGATPAPDRSRFYVFDDDGITIAAGDLSGLGERMSLDRTPGNVLQHRDSSKALVLYPKSNRVTYVDFADMKVLSEFVSGRTSKRVGKGFAFAGSILLEAAAGAYFYNTSPFGYQYYYQPVIVPYSGYVGPRTSGVFSDDGHFAYIFNGGTGDVTVFDTQKVKEVMKMPGGHHGIHFVQDNSMLLTLGAKKLRIFDMKRHEQLLETRSPGGLGGVMVLHPDDEHAYVWTPGGNVRLLNFKTKSVEREYDGVGGKVIRLRKESDELLQERQVRID